MRCQIPRCRPRCLHWAAVFIVLAIAASSPGQVPMIPAYPAAQPVGIEYPVGEASEVQNPQPSPPHQFDLDSILKWYMELSPQERRRIGHWAHRGIVNEFTLRNAEVFHLRRLMREEYERMKREGAAEDLRTARDQRYGDIILPEPPVSEPDTATSSVPAQTRAGSWHDSDLPSSGSSVQFRSYNVDAAIRRYDTLYRRGQLDEDQYRARRAALANDVHRARSAAGR